MSKGKIIYMVVPCYNEEEVLDETTKQLSDKLQKLIDAGEISEKSRILYVNDGSKDQTWPIICRLHEEYTLVSGLNLSRMLCLPALCMRRIIVMQRFQWMLTYRMIFMLLMRW